jgi:hypothetical protein
MIEKRDFFALLAGNTIKYTEFEVILYQLNLEECTDLINPNN